MKTHKNQYRILGTLVLLTMLLTLLFPTSTAFADDTTPPEEPTEVIDVPAEDEALPEGEVAADGEVPADVGAVPVEDETLSEDEVVSDGEMPADDEPTAEEVTTEEVMAEDSASEEKAQTEAEPVLAQLPEGTDLVVLDEEGETVPLATQETAEAIAVGDPMWCPDGVDPIANTNGCTASYSSLTSLLAYLFTNQPSEDGTIWIEKTYDSSIAEPGVTSQILINGNANITWRDYSLTIQGGWDGPGTSTVSGTSLFSGDRFSVINWQNDVTIRDIVIDGASGGSGLVVIVNDPGTNIIPDVTLENVEVKNSTDNYGAIIFNNDNTGSVTVNNSKFTNNGDSSGEDGLDINAKGNVTLLNVIATGNKGEGVDIDNTGSSINATVDVNGTNIFTGNTGIGLSVVSKGAITLSNVTADGSVSNGGAYLNNSQSGAVGDVTVTGTNSFSGNEIYGLQVYTRGAVNLENVNADGNKTSDGAYIYNIAGSGDVTIKGTNSFNGNIGTGLYLRSKGAITASNITANGNGGYGGAWFDNDETGAVGDVEIIGTNSFSGNNYLGLNIVSRGGVSLANITADDNKYRGVSIDNLPSSSFATVTIDGINSFSNNLNDGLWIRSLGTIKLNEIVADGNGTNVAHNGADISNSTGNGVVSITGYHNSFSNNAGPGLVINTNGNIELHFATIENNNLVGGPDGTQFTTSGSAKVYCSIFDNNGSVGLNASGVNGSLDFYGMDGFSDYSYNGAAGFMGDDCVIPVYGCTNPKALNFNPGANIDDGSCDYAVTDSAASGRQTTPTITSSYIPVTGGQFTEISCVYPLTVLQIQDIFSVTFSNLCGYEAMLETVAEEELPGTLPNGGQLVSSFNVALRQNSSIVDALPDGVDIIVSFLIPAGMEGENFAIMRWDGNNWVEESVSVEDGYVKALTSSTGTFVLVVQ